MDWQPIETAPRDGSRILLWVADGGDDHQGGICFGRRYEKSGRVQGEGMTGDWQFTHWMPLPPPPKG